MRICEPFAGLGSYGLRAFWESAGRHPRQRWEPPVSRVGNKSGFVVNTFRAFGLQRVKWDAVVWNDLDPVCHLFHLLYASSELRDAVARRIWAMVPCPHCLPDLVADALDGRARPTPEACKALMPGLVPVGDACPTCGGSGVQDARQLWEWVRKEAVPAHTMALLDSDLGRIWAEDEALIRQARGGAEEPFLRDLHDSTFLPIAELIARALFLQSRSFQLKPVSIEGGGWREAGYKKEVDDLPRAPTSHAAGDDSPRWTVAERVEALPGRWMESGFNPEDRRSATKFGCDQPRWTVADRLPLLPGPGGCKIGISRMDALEFARSVEFGRDDVVVLDPPYVGTTGYANNSSRANVLEIADMAARAGALVLLHEGIGLAKELGSGWYQRSASPLRARGSTFHAGGVEREWLTMNRKVAWWPAEQQGLFGG